MAKQANPAKLWIGASLALVVIVGLAVWMTRTPEEKAPAPAPVVQTPEPAPAKAPATGSTLGKAPAPPSAADQPPAGGDADANAAKYYEQIDDLLRDDNISNEEAGTKLAAIAADANAPLDLRTQALGHALNLIDDENFEKLNPLLQDPNAPDDLRDALVHDIYNRPVEVQLPAALLLYQKGSGEAYDLAEQLLEFRLEQNHGQDMGAWKKAIDELIAKEQAEQTDAAVEVGN